MVSSGHINTMDWDKSECEHLYEIETEAIKGKATYPTRKFFKERLDYCQMNNLAGVAIWDVAQGLESFLDEF